MKRKTRSGLMVGIATVILLALVAAFFVRLVTHRPPEVTLPQPDPAGSVGVVSPSGEGETVRRVEVTPETVQRVIERLARPENYARTVLIERFWSGGSGQTAAQVRTADGWTRVDLTDAGGVVRHSVTGGGQSWIWYGTDLETYTGAAALTGDEEQGIPTYEDLLQLDPASIAAADYRTYDGAQCICVETGPDAFGCSERWWIAVDSGLLIAAEREADGTVFYRMSAPTLEKDTVTAEAFTLPDGTVLYDPDTHTGEG